MEMHTTEPLLPFLDTTVLRYIVNDANINDGVNFNFIGINKSTDTRTELTVHTNCTTYHCWFGR